MRALAAAGLAVMCAGLTATYGAAQPARPAYRGQVVPLCPGLTIVTAISQPTGDYESIKRIESVTSEVIRVRYSSYGKDPKLDYDHPNPPPLIPYSVFRNIRVVDLDNAPAYQQWFTPGIPETIRNTTALGISARVYKTLKQTRKTVLGMYLQLVPGSINEDGEPTFSLMEFRTSGEIELTDAKPATMSVLVNDRPTLLPILRAKGTMGDYDADFIFLDDPGNPLALQFEIGTDTLDVIKVSYSCAGSSPDSSKGPPAPAPMHADFLERSLSDTGRVDVYSLYFAFNSDVIRDESEPTLREVADILKRHADWKLDVAGHTDGIASDVYNLDLSRRRAAAVKQRLVSTYGIAAARLTTEGFGEARPKDTNDTLQGRARNRRVELIRLP